MFAYVFAIRKKSSDFC